MTATETEAWLCPAIAGLSHDEVEVEGILWREHLVEGCRLTAWLCPMTNEVRKRAKPRRSQTLKPNAKRAERATTDCHFPPFCVAKMCASPKRHTHSDIFFSFFLRLACKPIHTSSFKIKISHAQNVSQKKP
jgi:hypothetical protein